MNAPEHRRHALQALRIPLALLLLALTAGLNLFAGCGLSTGGIPEVDGGGKPCTQASNCDDMNACTVDSCSSDGVCVNTPVANGPAPAADQTPGDCQSIVCTEGEPSSIEDDTNTPTSTNPCIDASCAAGKVTMAPQKDGTACTLNGTAGSCQASTCEVTCTTAAMCVSTNPCQTGICNGATGVCVFTNVTDGTPTPGVTQTTGDCRDQECVGGASTSVVDDSDIPAKMGDCQDPVCNNGTPAQSPHAEDSGCSTYMTNMSGFCDGMGHCEQCTKPSECAGTTNDCTHPACNTFACAIVNTAVNTPTVTNPPQVAGDCLTIVCDGNGGTKTVPADDPANSGTPCMTDTCNDGVAGTPVDNPGVMCGGTVAMPEDCTDSGQCGCMTNADCTAPNTCGGGNPGTPLFCGCTKTTCAAQKTTCGMISDGCFGMLDCNDNTQDGNETDVDCGGGAQASDTCTNLCAQGKKCKVDGDCASTFCVDGVCCNTGCTGTCVSCSAALKGSGADGVCGATKSGTDPQNQCPASNMMTCGDSGGCNGSSACTLWPSNTVCMASSCNGTVLTKQELCNGTGTCNAQGMPMQDCAPYKCTGTPVACPTSCAVDTDCASTSDYCNGSNQCVPKLTNGTACPSNPMHCASGICADGVCCNATCGGNCMACTMALTGMPSGTCNTASNGTNPRGQCATTAATSCGTNGTCESGACAFYPATQVCVMASCAGSQATPQVNCTGSGSCPTYTKTPCNPYICGPTACLAGCGTSDSNCITGDYCDGVGAGVCHAKVAVGGACANSDQCANGATCGGGYCCASACPDQGAASCGTNGMCASGTGDCMQYPSGTMCSSLISCTGPMAVTSTDTACDGNGNCNQSPVAGNCPGNTSCINGTSCYGPTCMANDNECAMGYYCNGVSPGTPPGTCVAQQTTGSPCTRDPECTMGCNTGMGTCK